MSTIDKFVKRKAQVEEPGEDVITMKRDPNVLNRALNVAMEALESIAQGQGDEESAEYALYKIDQLLEHAMVVE